MIEQVRRDLQRVADDLSVPTPVDIDRPAEKVNARWGSQVKIFVPVPALRTARESHLAVNDHAGVAD